MHVVEMIKVLWNNLNQRIRNRYKVYKKKINVMIWGSKVQKRYFHGTCFQKHMNNALQMEK